MYRVILVFLVLLVALSSAWAATKSTSTSNTPNISGYTIAFVPLEITGGRGVAKEKLPEVYRDVFTNEGFQTVMGQPVEAAMQKLNIRIGGGLPTNKELLRLGKELRTDYVLAANIKVETKKVWVMLVPQAKSTITIDTIIVNVKKAEVVYDPKNAVGVSQGGSDLQKGVGLVVFYPAALFMGGSRSSEERKAAEKVVQPAYEDFFASLRASKKIK